MAGLLVAGLTLTLTLNAAEELEAVWTHAGVGDWKDPANWRDGVVPVNSSSQTFAVTVALTNQNVLIQPVISESIEMSRLTLLNRLHAGTSEDNHDIHIRDMFHWSGGSLTGWQSRYHSHGLALFDGLTQKRLDRRCELFLHGSARWTAGQLHFAGYGHFWIEPGAELIAEVTGYIGDPASTSRADLHNRGTFRILAPGHTVAVQGPFHNQGQVEVSEGTVDFAEGLDGTGSFRISPSGNLVVSDWATFSGNDLDNQGILRISGTVTVGATTRFSGTTLIEGVLQGDGDAVLPDALASSATFMGNGWTVVPEDGRFHIEGPSSVMHRSMANHGTVSLGTGQVLLSNAAVLSNAPPGLLELRTGSSIGNRHNTAGRLFNIGRVLKDDGQGPVEVNVAAENHGTIEVQQGTLYFHLGLRNFGELNVLEGAKLSFNHLLDSSWDSSWSGAGTVEVLQQAFMSGLIDTNLSLAVADRLQFMHDEPVAVRSLELGPQPSAWLIHTNFLDILEEFDWRAGMVAGPGTLRSLNTARIHIPPELAAETAAPLELSGLTNWEAGTVRLDGPRARLLNSGSLWMSGGRLELQAGEYVNTGFLRTRENIAQLELNLSPDGTSLTAHPLPTGEVRPPGFTPYAVLGDVGLVPGQLTLGNSAFVALTGLVATNARIQLETGSTLHIEDSAVLEQTRVELNGGRIRLPGECQFARTTISGAGLVDARVTGPGTRLEATRTNATLHLLKTLAMDATSSIRIAVDQRDLRLNSSALRVEGRLDLAGELHLDTPSTPLLMVQGDPVVLVESGEAIRGSFANVRSGEWHVTTNGRYRFLVHYGPGSPFPENQIVLEAFGTPYDLWRNQQYPMEVLEDIDRSGPGGDVNGDGIPNVVDFVFGEGAAPLFDLESLPGQLLITVDQREDASLPRVHWFGSSNLKQWNPLSPHRSYGSQGRVIHVFLVSPAPPGSYFFRMEFLWPEL